MRWNEKKPVRQIKKEGDGAAKVFFQSETVPFCLNAPAGPKIKIVCNWQISLPV